MSLCLRCTEVVPQAGSKQASTTGMAVTEEPTDTQAGRPDYLEMCSKRHWPSLQPRAGNSGCTSPWILPVPSLTAPIHNPTGPFLRILPPCRKRMVSQSLPMRLLSHHPTLTWSMRQEEYLCSVPNLVWELQSLGFIWVCSSHNMYCWYPARASNFQFPAAWEKVNALKITTSSLHQELTWFPLFTLIILSLLNWVAI